MVMIPQYQGPQPLFILIQLVSLDGLAQCPARSLPNKQSHAIRPIEELSWGGTERNPYPIHTRRLHHFDVFADFFIRRIVIGRWMVPVTVAPSRARNDSPANEIYRPV